MGGKSNRGLDRVGRAQKEVERTLLDSLPARIRAERQAQNLTLEELAQKAGVHWTTLGKIERGQQLPSIALLAVLSEALGIGCGQLVSSCLGESRASGDDAAIAELQELPIAEREALVPVLRALVEWRLG